jgi:hypothetical protein
MSLNIPQQLAWLAPVVAGQDFPDGSEDQLSAQSASWAATAKALMAVTGLVAAAGQQVQSGLSGPTGDQFAAFQAQVVQNLPQIAQGAQQLAELCQETALQIQYTKYMIILQLFWTAEQIIEWSATVAGLAAVPLIEAAGREAVRSVAEALLRQVARSVGESVAAMVAMDAAVQTLQFLEGDRHSWDVQDTVQSLEMGALTGAVGAGLGTLGHLVAPDLLKGLMGHVALGAVTGVANAEVSDAAFGGGQSALLGGAAGAVGGLIGGGRAHAAEGGDGAKALDIDIEDVKAPDFVLDAKVADPAVFDTDDSGSDTEEIAEPVSPDGSDDTGSVFSGYTDEVEDGEDSEESAGPAEFSFPTAVVEPVGLPGFADLTDTANSDGDAAATVGAIDQDTYTASVPRGIAEDESWWHSPAQRAEWFDPPARPLQPDQWEQARPAAPALWVDTAEADVLSSSRIYVEESTGKLTVELKSINGIIRYDARRIEAEPGRWVREYTVRLDLAATGGVTPAELDGLRARAQQGVDSMLNAGYRLPGGDQFHVRVEFNGADPAPGAASAPGLGRHRTTVQVARQQDYVSQTRWGLDTPAHELAHEILHYTGARDENHDPQFLLRGAARATGGVQVDNGLMGADVSADAALLPRHAWVVDRVTASQGIVPDMPYIRTAEARLEAESAGVPAPETSAARTAASHTAYLAPGPDEDPDVRTRGSSARPIADEVTADENADASDPVDGAAPAHGHPLAVTEVEAEPAGFVPPTAFPDDSAAVMTAGPQDPDESLTHVEEGEPTPVTAPGTPSRFAPGNASESGPADSTGGRWSILPGAYTEPSLTGDEPPLLAPSRLGRLSGSDYLPDLADRSLFPPLMYSHVGRPRTAEPGDGPLGGPKLRTRPEQYDERDQNRVFAPPLYSVGDARHQAIGPETVDFPDGRVRQRILDLAEQLFPSRQFTPAQRAAVRGQLDRRFAPDVLEGEVQQAVGDQLTFSVYPDSSAEDAARLRTAGHEVTIRLRLGDWRQITDPRGQPIAGAAAPGQAGRTGATEARTRQVLDFSEGASNGHGMAGGIDGLTGVTYTQGVKGDPRDTGFGATSQGRAVYSRNNRVVNISSSASTTRYAKGSSYRAVDFLFDVGVEVFVKHPRNDVQYLGVVVPRAMIVRYSREQTRRFDRGPDAGQRFMTSDDPRAWPDGTIDTPTARLHDGHQQLSTGGVGTLETALLPPGGGGPGIVTGAMRQVPVPVPVPVPRISVPVAIDRISDIRGAIFGSVNARYSHEGTESRRVLTGFASVQSILGGIIDAADGGVLSATMYGKGPSSFSRPEAVRLTATFYNPKVVGDLDEFTRLDSEDVFQRSHAVPETQSDVLDLPISGNTSLMGLIGVAPNLPALDFVRGVDQNRPGPGAGHIELHKLKFTSEPTVLVRFIARLTVANLSGDRQPQEVDTGVWVRMFVKDAERELGLDVPRPAGVGPREAIDDIRLMNETYARQRVDDALARPDRELQLPDWFDSWLPPTTRISGWRTSPTVVLEDAVDLVDAHFPGFLASADPNLPDGHMRPDHQVRAFENYLALAHALAPEALARRIHVMANGGFDIPLVDPGLGHGRQLTVRVEAQVDRASMAYQRTLSGQMEVYYGDNVDLTGSSRYSRAISGGLDLSLGIPVISRHLESATVKPGLRLSWGRGTTDGSGYGVGGAVGGGTQWLAQFRGTIRFRVSVRPGAGVTPVRRAGAGDALALAEVGGAGPALDQIGGAADAGAAMDAGAAVWADGIAEPGVPAVRARLRAITADVLVTEDLVEELDRAAAVPTFRPALEFGTAMQEGRAARFAGGRLIEPVEEEPDLEAEREPAGSPTDWAALTPPRPSAPGRTTAGGRRTGPAAQWNRTSGRQSAAKPGAAGAAPIADYEVLRRPPRTVKLDWTPAAGRPGIPQSALLMGNTAGLRERALAGLEHFDIRLSPIQQAHLDAALAGAGPRLRDFMGGPRPVWTGRVDRSWALDPRNVADRMFQVSLEVRPTRLTALGPVSDSAYTYRHLLSGAAVTHGHDSFDLGRSLQIQFTAPVRARRPDGDPTPDTFTAAGNFSYSRTDSENSSVAAGGQFDRVQIDVGEHVWARGEARITVTVAEWRDMPVIGRMSTRPDYVVPLPVDADLLAMIPVHDAERMADSTAPAAVRRVLSDPGAVESFRPPPSADGLVRLPPANVLRGDGIGHAMVGDVPDLTGLYHAVEQTALASLRPHEYNALTEELGKATTLVASKATVEQLLAGYSLLIPVHGYLVVNSYIKVNLKAQLGAPRHVGRVPAPSVLERKNVRTDTVRRGIGTSASYSFGGSLNWALDYANRDIVREYNSGGAGGYTVSASRGAFDARGTQESLGLLSLPGLDGQAPAEKFVFPLQVQASIDVWRSPIALLNTVSLDMVRTYERFAVPGIPSDMSLELSYPRALTRIDLGGDLPPARVEVRGRTESRPPGQIPELRGSPGVLSQDDLREVDVESVGNLAEVRRQAEELLRAAAWRPDSASWQFGLQRAVHQIETWTSAPNMVRRFLRQATAQDDPLWLTLPGIVSDGEVRLDFFAALGSWHETDTADSTRVTLSDTLTKDFQRTIEQQGSSRSLSKGVSGTGTVGLKPATNARRVGDPSAPGALDTLGISTSLAPALTLAESTGHGGQSVMREWGDKTTGRDFTRLSVDDVRWTLVLHRAAEPTLVRTFDISDEAAVLWAPTEALERLRKLNVRDGDGLQETPPDSPAPFATLDPGPSNQAPDDGDWSALAQRTDAGPSGPVHGEWASGQAPSRPDGNSGRGQYQEPIVVWPPSMRVELATPGERAPAEGWDAQGGKDAADERFEPVPDAGPSALPTSAEPTAPAPGSTTAALAERDPSDTAPVWSPPTSAPVDPNLPEYRPGSAQSEPDSAHQGPSASQVIRWTLDSPGGPERDETFPGLPGVPRDGQQEMLRNSAIEAFSGTAGGSRRDGTDGTSHWYGRIGDWAVQGVAWHGDDESRPDRIVALLAEPVPDEWQHGLETHHGTWSELPVERAGGDFNGRIRMVMFSGGRRGVEWILPLRLVVSDAPDLDGEYVMRLRPRVAHMIEHFFPVHRTEGGADGTYLVRVLVQPYVESAEHRGESELAPQDAPALDVTRQLSDDELFSRVVVTLGLDHPDQLLEVTAAFAESYDDSDASVLPQPSPVDTAGSQVDTDGSQVDTAESQVDTDAAQIAAARAQIAAARARVETLVSAAAVDQFHRRPVDQRLEIPDWVVPPVLSGFRLVDHGTAIRVIAGEGGGSRNEPDVWRFTARRYESENEALVRVVVLAELEPEVAALETRQELQSAVHGMIHSMYNTGLRLPGGDGLIVEMHFATSPGAADYVISRQSLRGLTPGDTEAWDTHAYAYTIAFEFGRRLGLHNLSAAERQPYTSADAERGEAVRRLPVDLSGVMELAQIVNTALARGATHPMGPVTLPSRRADEILHGSGRDPSGVLTIRDIHGPALAFRSGPVNDNGTFRVHEWVMLPAHWRVAEARYAAVLALINARQTGWTRPVDPADGDSGAVLWLGVGAGVRFLGTASRDGEIISFRPSRDQRGLTAFDRPPAPRHPLDFPAGIRLLAQYGDHASRTGVYFQNPPVGDTWLEHGLRVRRTRVLPNRTVEATVEFRPPDGGVSGHGGFGDPSFPAHAEGTVVQFPAMWTPDGLGDAVEGAYDGIARARDPRVVPIDPDGRHLWLGEFAGVWIVGLTDGSRHLAARPARVQPYHSWDPQAEMYRSLWVAWRGGDDADLSSDTDADTDSNADALNLEVSRVVFDNGQEGIDLRATVELRGEQDELPDEQGLDSLAREVAALYNRPELRLDAFPLVRMNVRFIRQGAAAAGSDEPGRIIIAYRAGTTGARLVSKFATAIGLTSESMHLAADRFVHDEVNPGRWTWHRMRNGEFDRPVGYANVHNARLGVLRNLVLPPYQDGGGPRLIARVQVVGSRAAHQLPDGFAGEAALRVRRYEVQRLENADGTHTTRLLVRIYLSHASRPNGGADAAQAAYAAQVRDTVAAVYNTGAQLPNSDTLEIHVIPVDYAEQAHYTVRIAPDADTARPLVWGDRLPGFVPAYEVGYLIGLHGAHRDVRPRLGPGGRRGPAMEDLRLRPRQLEQVWDDVREFVEATVPGAAGAPQVRIPPELLEQTLYGDERNGWSGVLVRDRTLGLARATHAGAVHPNGTYRVNSSTTMLPEHWSVAETDYAVRVAIADAHRIGSITPAADQVYSWTGDYGSVRLSGTMAQDGTVTGFWATEDQPDPVAHGPGGTGSWAGAADRFQGDQSGTVPTLPARPGPGAQFPQDWTAQGAAHAAAMAHDMAIRMPRGTIADGEQGRYRWIGEHAGVRIEGSVQDGRILTYQPSAVQPHWRWPDSQAPVIRHEPVQLDLGSREAPLTAQLQYVVFPGGQPGMEIIVPVRVVGRARVGALTLEAVRTQLNGVVDRVYRPVPRVPGGMLIRLTARFVDGGSVEEGDDEASAPGRLVVDGPLYRADRERAVAAGLGVPPTVIGMSRLAARAVARRPWEAPLVDPERVDPELLQRHLAEVRRYQDPPPAPVVRPPQWSEADGGAGSAPGTGPASERSHSDDDPYVADDDSFYSAGEHDFDFLEAMPPVHVDFPAQATAQPPAGHTADSGPAEPSPGHHTDAESDFFGIEYESRDEAEPESDSGRDVAGSPVPLPASAPAQPAQPAQGDSARDDPVQDDSADDGPGASPR